MSTQAPGTKHVPIDRIKIEAKQRAAARLIQLRTRQRNLTGNHAAKAELAQVEAQIKEITDRRKQIDGN